MTSIVDCLDWKWTANKTFWGQLKENLEVFCGRKGLMIFSQKNFLRSWWRTGITWKFSFNIRHKNTSHAKIFCWILFSHNMVIYCQKYHLWNLCSSSTYYEFSMYDINYFVNIFSFLFKRKTFLHHTCTVYSLKKYKLLL